MKHQLKRHRILALAGVLLSVTALNGTSLGQPSGDFDYQQPRAFPGQAGMSKRGGRQDRAVRFSDYTNAYGESVVVPASYSPGCGCGAGCGPSCGGPACGCGMCAGGIGSCNMCGPGGPGVYGQCPPAGTSPPFGYDDGMSDLIGAGSMGLNQAGPHYFDVRAEVVFMSRDETFGQSLTFARDNVNGPIVLTADALDYDFEPGFRIIGRYDLGPLSVFEFGYFGIYDWDSRAVAVDQGPLSNSGEGDLFSLFSGTFENPSRLIPANTSAPNGPHSQTERSMQQSLRMTSDLQTVEMTFRRYWVGYTPRISGTVLAGARYTRLSEGFNYNIQGGSTNIGATTFDYDIDVENDLVGFQAGGDMWISLVQGVRVGTEGKAGIFNNRFKVDSAQTTNVNTGLLNPSPFNENFSGDNVAFIGEGSLDIVIDVLPSWSIRGGYEVLFINSLALAGNNFNSGKIYNDQNAADDPANLGLPDRASFVSDQGNALYHGWHLGAEYIW